MPTHRFYARPEDFSADETLITLGHEEAHHLCAVLRLREGAEVFVFDGCGREFRCIVSAIEKRSGIALLKIEEEVLPTRPESPLRLALALALLKGEKFDLVVQKATELGVTRITPLLTRFSDIKMADPRDAARRVARWRRLAIEAAKQSGRARVPEVADPTGFAEFIENERRAADEGELARRLPIIFAERAGRDLREIRSRHDPKPQIITAVVGPEGGWSEEEIRQASQKGWEIVTLGGRTLRAETAAIVAVALLQHLYGDL
ncbi:MAG: 16S rRNA (uracil(1498)-N(3))-methyltransferase [Pyrinomonas methylaliphatogenes]|nr:16S rRNA (uracil(1498)-N(3))-methyltransferase [Pyrinomonas methylaliphatogenes]